MAYLLDATIIRAPHGFSETNDTQVAQNRTLSGSITRDYFGSNKRVWVLEYRNTKKADYDIINGIYASYLSTGTTKSWAVTETNYAVTATVHLDLKTRGFNVKGTNYISDFTLTLTEA